MLFRSNRLPYKLVRVRTEPPHATRTIHCKGYGRGLDAVNGAYQLLDLVPKGRNEAGQPHPMSWVRHHDKYDAPLEAPEAKVSA